MSNPLVIWGAGGHGHVLADLASSTGKWKVVGFIDNRLQPGETCMGIPCLGQRDILPRLLSKGIAHLAIAIGDARIRHNLALHARAIGFHLPNLVHPSAQISRFSHFRGDGIVCCANSFVGPLSELNDGCIVNTGANVDHDNTIGAYAHLAPHATLCGFVTVGEYTWIGANAVVRDHVSIGTHTIVGMGAVITKSVGDKTTIFGNPGKEQLFS